MNRPALLTLVVFISATSAIGCSFGESFARTAAGVGLWIAQEICEDVLEKQYSDQMFMTRKRRSARESDESCDAVGPKVSPATEAPPTTLQVKPNANIIETEQRDERER